MSKTSNYTGYILRMINIHGHQSIKEKNQSSRIKFSGEFLLRYEVQQEATPAWTHQQLFMFSVPRLAKSCEIISVCFVVGCWEMCPFYKKKRQMEREREKKKNPGCY